MDFPTYSQWNPYLRTQVVEDEDKRPLVTQRAETGRRLHLKMNLPPTMDDSAKHSEATEIITVVDSENFRFAWRFATPARWAIHAERWQTLRVVNGKTTYETWEVFGGILAYLIWFFMKGKLQKAFDEMAQSLKSRAELVD
ncbi:hypothetical protein FA95DRAFT_1559110 [Auriscalpium vulgare]|uniref:Uncharacterized protein n=1 Tax=Auriscalpium vulgare TaxID=40419 RepID=A0ACB8RTK7_9AGAM|nr:hypothetical protein FA95DRAFT_1559110 [Auriscalpium vulgare]